MLDAIFRPTGEQVRIYSHQSQAIVGPDHVLGADSEGWFASFRKTDIVTPALYNSSVMRAIRGEK